MSSADAVVRLEARLRRIEAELEIVRLKSRYLYAGDQGDLRTILDCFTPDAVIDFPAFGLTGGLADMERAFSAALSDSGMVHIHRALNPEITVIDDDHARATWGLSYLAYDRQGRTLFNDSGIYLDEYRRTDTRWRISSCRTLIQLNLAGPLPASLEASSRKTA